MRLFEGIREANQRAAAGDPTAGIHRADFAEALPIVALTCIDPRLNPTALRYFRAAKKRNKALQPGLRFKNVAPWRIYDLNRCEYFKLTD